MRKKLIAGNWKMHKTVQEAVAIVDKLVPQVQGLSNTQVAVCPPYTALQAVGEKLANSSVGLGAQNCFWAESGAYTGEIAPSMLLELGCQYVILGHSERRQLLGETNPLINQKLKAALQAGLVPILCVGETLEQREAHETNTIILGQIDAALAGISAPSLDTLVVAYEPIWAIGTGRSSNGEDANQVIGAIRERLASLYSSELAAKIRILYGGSVKSSNIAEFIGQSDIDGALVGGASLDADEFAKIALEADVAK